MADSIVEPSSSASVSSISSMVQNQQQAVNLNALNPNIIPIISADIQVENVSTQQQLVARPSPPSQTPTTMQTTTTTTTADPNDEPDAKRKRIEPAAQPSTSQSNEKLESRLGGILCCAVCLDLPKTAMYQVGFSIQSICLFTYIIQPDRTKRATKRKREEEEKKKTLSQIEHTKIWKLESYGRHDVRRVSAIE